MHEAFGVTAAPGAMVTSPGTGLRPPRDPSAAGAGDSPEIKLRLADDHDRIAEGLNNLVVRRLFSAGLVLETALALIGDHQAAGFVQHAISELDSAIRDIRDTVFDCRRPDPPGSGPAG